MSEKKQYMIRGEINKHHFFEPMKFKMIVAAIKKEHALQKIYSELGSRHRAKRVQIIIQSIDEVFEE
jgi:large subunit ribosomal protein LX